MFRISLLGLIALGACQMLTELDELETRASIVDASVSAVDAAVDHDAAPTCPLSAGCVAMGSNAPGSRCHDSSECARDQACDRNVCRAYCDSDRDCKNGGCFPVAGPDGVPVEATKTCWTSCDSADADGCGDGASCRRVKTPYATVGNYCVAPLQPCPTIEDGVCDEATGTGACADGTDVKDCSCVPPLPGAACDPLAGCGCPDGKTCHLARTNSSAAKDARTFGATCGEAGYQPLYASCSANTDCAIGLTCDPDLSVCTRACRADADCADGACAEYQTAAGRVVGFCKPSCNRTTKRPCLGDATCATFDERTQFSDITPGNYCWVPLAAACPDDGICDEPKGTRLCAADTDTRDCCKPPSEGGECDPVSQCGCAAKPDTQCRHLPFSTITQCLPRGYDPPWSRCSAPGDNCPPGYACGNGACRKYCATEDDCDGVGNLCISFPDREGEDLEKIGACFMACDYSKADSCPPSLLCARMSPLVSLCVVPFAVCPSEYLNNGDCDDTRAGGSRICEMGTDPECG